MKDDNSDGITFEDKSESSSTTVTMEINTLSYSIQFQQSFWKRHLEYYQSSFAPEGSLRSK